MRIRGRSYMGFVFTPEAPLAEWLQQLDVWLARSPGFFAGRLVVLDLSAVTLSRSGIAHLLDSLQERNIRIVGLEGVDPVVAGVGLPPILQGGRSSNISELERRPEPEPEKPAAPAVRTPTSLLLQEPVRSGQSVVFTEGDVTVLGSVGSGAEIVAGGSIHIYGTLRGRAMAGATGNPQARIFCHRIEAELLAIDGYYMTADEVDASLRSRPTQAWLEGSTLMITALN
jgi:septum site-determining protein MinC